MLQHLLHTAINKQKWDACISQSREQVVYAFSWYLDVVSPGWHALVEEQDGKYVAVMPLPVKRKFGYTYIQQPLFCQQLGVFSVFSELSPLYFEQFLDLVIANYRYVISYQFNTDNTFALNTLADKYHLKSKFTHYLKLNKPYSEIYKNYSRDRKNNLKKGKKAAARIIEKPVITPLLDLFKSDISGKIYGGVADAAYQQFRDLTQVLIDKKLARIYYTKSEGSKKEEAGVMLIEQHDKLIYIFNAASQKGRKNNGRMVLLDHLIKAYSPGKFTFDFESPEVESIAYFYNSFGAEPVRFYTFSYNNLPWPVKQARAIRMRIFRFLFR